MSDNINPQIPLARCDFEDSPEQGMVLIVNGVRYLMSPRETVELNDKLNRAVMRWFRLFWKG